MSSAPTLSLHDINYQTIIHQAPIGYALHKIIYDKDGRPSDYCFVEINTAFENFTGLKAPDIIGKTAKEVFTGPEEVELEWIPFFCDIAIHGGNATFEKFSRSHGKYYEISALSPNKGYFITFIKDLNKENVTYDNFSKTEISIKESENKYDHLLDFTPDAFFQTDVHGKILMSNEKAVLLTGYGNNELKSLNISDLLPGTETKTQFFRLASSDLKKIQFAEQQIRRKNGELIEIEIYSRRLPDGIYESFIRDISDKKHFADSLHNSELRYKRLVENSPDIVYSFSTKRGRSYHSDQVIHILGYTPEQLKSDPMLWYNSIHPDDQPMVDRVLKSTVMGHHIDMEYRILTSDGSWKWLHDRSLHMYHVKDETIIDGLAMDITRRKVTEIELQFTKETYQDIFNTLTEAIFILDPSGNFIEVNNGAEKLYKMTREDLIGKSPESLAAPELNDMQEIERMMREVFQTSIPVNFEFWGQRKTGEIFPVEVIIKRGNYFGTDVMIATARDITERKSNEEALRESEEKYRKIAENISDVIFTTDLDFNVLYVSPSIERLYGEPAELAMQREMNEKFSEADIEKFYSILEKELVRDKDPGIDKNRTITIEAELKKVDGSIIHISSSLTFIRNKDGQPVGIQGTTRDITEKINADKKLKQSEERFRELGTMLPVAVFETTSDLILTFANKKAFELFGYTEEDLIKGFMCLEILAPSERENAMRLMQNNTVGNKPVIFEFLAKHKNGSFFPIVLHINTILENDTLVGYRGIAIDISERKKTEALIRESEEKFRSLALLSPFAIMIYQDDRWVYTNPAGENITGYSADELINMNFESFVSEEYVSVIRDRSQHNQTGEQQTASFEIKIITKEGTEKWMYFLSTFIEFNGIPAELIAAADITQRKQSEAELIRAKSKAEESDRLKSAFLANLSHEIRTPMNGILGFLELLKEINLSNEEKNYFIDVVNESSQRLLNTINDIIEMSKIDSEQIELHLSEVNLEKEMQYHYNFFKQITEKKDIHLICNQNIQDESAIIETDKSKLDSILVNLINNAILFTDRGSVEFGNFLDGSMIIFYVKDTGCGIPVHRQHAIFDRFVQADLSTTRQKEGSGLGLSIAKAYTEMLGGKIWYTSEEGLGSTFYFSIPYTPRKAKTAFKPPVSVKELPTEQVIKILIAEDDETSFRYLECILNNKNIVLIHTVSGEDTIEVMKKNHDISIILMDIRMPGMNGFEATKKIREFNQKIPIIAQTAYALDGDREEAINTGCDDYISKPINRNKLLQIIRQHIGQSISGK